MGTWTSTACSSARSCTEGGRRGPRRGWFGAVARELLRVGAVVCTLATALAGCDASGGGNDAQAGGQTAGPGGGSGSAARGKEGGLCFHPEGGCAACFAPTCDDGLACFASEVTGLGEYGACHAEGAKGDSCETWKSGSQRHPSGTCGSEGGVILQCCGALEQAGSGVLAGGLCARFDDPACKKEEDPDACGQCLSACKGLPGCCTGCNCMCESECGGCF